MLEQAIAKATEVKWAKRFVRWWAKIWVSVIPENQISLALRVLERNIYNLQKKLDKRLKMRPVPRVEFLKESKLGEAQKIEEILDKIREEKDWKTLKNEF